MSHRKQFASFLASDIVKYYLFFKSVIIERNQLSRGTKSLQLKNTLRVHKTALTPCSSGDPAGAADLEREGAGAVDRAAAAAKEGAAGEAGGARQGETGDKVDKIVTEADIVIVCNLK